MYLFSPTYTPYLVQLIVDIYIGMEQSLANQHLHKYTPHTPAGEKKDMQ